MAVTAVQPGLFPTALLRDTAAAPPLRPDITAAPRTPDSVVFSSAPFRALAELAATGLWQLAALLPTIEQAVEDQSLEPLAHLAKAAGAAAQQVNDGHAALLAAGPDRVAAALPGAIPPRAVVQSDPLLRTLVRQIGTLSEPGAEQGAEQETEPGFEHASKVAVDLQPSDMLRTAARQIGAAALSRPPNAAGEASAEPAQLWLAEAKHLLHRTGDALDQASVLFPLAPASALLPLASGGSPQDLPNPASLAIAAAQLQIASAFSSLAQISQPPRRGATPSNFGLRLLSNRLSGATSVMGALILLTIMSLASGLWSVCLGLLGLTATMIWIWRIGRAARGVTLDAGR